MLNEFQGQNMKTASAKAKGRKLCKEVKEMVHDFNPELQDDDVAITSSGSNGEDIRLSPLARGYLPVSIECKNKERLNIWEALKQAEENCKDFDPIVVFRRNRSKTYAVIEAEQLFWMLRLRYENERDTTDLSSLHKGAKQ